jgi:5-methylcytosine-specific restriction endonuclease McrA
MDQKTDKMNHFKMSDGTRISKEEIDRRVKEAKKQKLADQLEAEGYNFCQDCGKSSGVYLDCSHVISVKKCQESGHSEWSWDLENIKIICRDCHQKLDGLDLRF